MNDILKVIVDAELKKNSSLEESLKQIKSEFGKFEIDVTLKGAEGIEKLLKNLEAVGAKAGEAGSKAGNAGKKASKATKDAVNQTQVEIENLSKAIDGILKKQEILNKKGRTTKATTGDGKFKSTTVTELNGEEVQRETTENYKALNQLYDKMMDKSAKFTSLQGKEREEFKKKLQYLKESKALVGQEMKKSKNGKEHLVDVTKDLGFGSDEFMQNVKAIQKEYDKLEAREKAYQRAIKERPKLEDKINKAKRSDNNLLTDSDWKKVNDELYGDGKKKASATDLKSVGAVDGRLKKASQLFDELIEKNKKLNKEMDELFQQEKAREKSFNDKDMKDSKKLQDDANALKKLENDEFVKNEAKMIKAEEDRLKLQQKLLQERLGNAKKEADEVNKQMNAKADAWSKGQDVMTKAEQSQLQKRLDDAKEDAKVANALLKEKRDEWEKHEEYKKKHEEKRKKAESDALEKSADEIRKRSVQELADKEKKIMEDYHMQVKADKLLRDNHIKNEKEKADAINKEMNKRAEAWQKSEDNKFAYTQRKAMEESVALQAMADKQKKERDAKFKAEEDRMVKNSQTKEKARYFSDQKLNDIKNSGFVDAKRDGFIKPEEVQRVEKMFEDIADDTKDITFELRKANQELKKLEDKRNELMRTNQVNSKSAVQKNMDMNIKKSRHNENADLMAGRGIVDKGQLDNFKRMADALNLKSTKEDIEAVQKKWRELLNEEKNLTKEKRKGESVDKEREKNLESLIASTHSLTEKTKTMGNNIEKAFASGKLNTEEYQKLQQEMSQVAERIEYIRNNKEKMDNSDKRYLNSEMARINRLIDAYREMGTMRQREANRAEAEVRREQARTEREQINTARQGVRSQLTDGFNFDRLDSNNTRANQDEIARQITALTRALHAQDGEYARIEQSQVRVRRTTDALNNEIYRVSYTVDRGDREFEDYSLTLDATNRRIGDLGRNMRQTRGEMSIFQQMGTALSKVPIWGFATALVYGIQNQVMQGFEMIKEFDKAMTDLRKVANEGRDEVKGFEADAVSLGKNLGVTADQVVQATTEFSRLGYTLNEAKGLAENSLIYANVGDMGVEDASKFMVSALKGFSVAEKDSVEMSRRYGDIFNEVSNNFAISADGIGEALSRSSAILHQSGNSIEQAVALITAANTTIQDPKVVGTAMKTIAMRMRGVDEEGKKVVGLIPEMEGHFQRLGLTMKKDENTFKSTFQIFDELAKKWGTMTDMQRAQMTEMLAGKRQGSIVASMLENWTDATNAYTSALESNGSAQREFDRYTDSYQYKLGQLKGATEEFWLTFYDSDSVKTAIDSLTSFVEALTWMTEKFGILAPLTSFFLTFGLMFNKPLRDFVLFGRGLQELGGIIGAVTRASGGFLKILMRFAGVGLPFVALTFVIEKLAGQFVKASRAKEEYLRTLRDEVQQNGQLLEQYDKMISDGDMARYDELTNKNVGTLSIEERKELIDLQEKLKGVTSEVIEYYTDEGEAVYKSAEAIEKLIEMKRQQYAEQQKVLAKEELEQYDYSDIEEAVDNYQSALSKAKDLQTRADGVSIVRGFYENEIKNAKIGSQEMETVIQDMLDALDDKLGSQQMTSNFLAGGGNTFLMALREKNGTKEDLEKYFNEFIAGIEDASGKASKAMEDSKVTLESKATEIDQYMAKIAEGYSIDKHVLSNSNENKFIQDFAQSFSKGLKTVKGDADDFAKYMDSFGEVMDNVREKMSHRGLNVSKLYQDGGSESELARLKGLASEYDANSAEAIALSAVIDTLIQRQAELGNQTAITTDEFVMSNQKMAELTAQYDGAVSNITFLNKALEEMKEKHKLGADTMGDMIDKFPQLLQHMGNEESMIKAVEKAIVNETNTAKEALQKKLELNNEFYQKALQQHDSFFSGLSKAYGIDLTQFKNLAEAKRAVTEKLINVMGKGWARYFEITSDNMVKLNNQALNMMTGDDTMTGAKAHALGQARSVANSINKELSSINAEFNSITLDAVNINTDFKNLGLSDKKDKKPKKEKEKKADQPDYQDAIDAWIRQNQLKEEAIQLENELLEVSRNKAKEEGNYKKQIELTTKAIALQQKHMREMVNTNNRINSKMAEVRKGTKWNTSNWMDANGEATVAYVNFYNKLSKAQQEQAELVFSRLQKLKKQHIENQKEYKELASELSQLNQELAQIKFENAQREVENLTKAYEIAVNKISGLVSKIDRAMEFIDEEDKAGSINMMNNRTLALMQEKKVIEQHIAQMKKLRETYKGYPEVVAQINDQLINMGNSLADIDSQIFQNQQNMKEIYKELAEEVIEQYIDALERERDTKLEALEDEMKLEEERHETRIKNLEDEMSLFEKYINQQLKAIDKQKQDDNFLDGLNKLTKQETELRAKIASYSMDGTLEGKAKREQLEKELAELLEEIAKTKEDREIELRKESLQQQLDDKKEHIDEIKDEEDKLLEEQQKNLDESRDAINKHYDNLIADEERWNNIREMIMNESFHNIEKGLQGMIDEVSAGSKEMGDNIANNLINKLKEALDLMNKLEKDGITPDWENDNSDMVDDINNQVRDNSLLGKADYKLMSAKHLIAQLMPFAKTDGQRQGLLNRAQDTAEQARNEGSIIDPNNTKAYADLIAGMSDKEKLLQAKYIRQYVVPQISTPELREKLAQLSYKMADEARAKLGKDFWSNLSFDDALTQYSLGFDTGGYTGQWGDKSGKLAMLHEKELILNKVDTKNILDTVSIVRNLSKFLPSIQRPTVTRMEHKEENSRVQVGDVNLYIDRLEGGEEGAKSLVKNFVSALGRKGVKL